MRFYKLRISVAIAMIMFVLVFGTIVTIGTIAHPTTPEIAMQVVTRKLAVDPIGQPREIAPVVEPPTPVVQDDTEPVPSVQPMVPETPVDVVKTVQEPVRQPIVQPVPPTVVKHRSLRTRAS